MSDATNSNTKYRLGQGRQGVGVCPATVDGCRGVPSVALLPDQLLEAHDIDVLFNALQRLQLPQMNALIPTAETFLDVLDGHDITFKKQDW